MLLTEAPGTGIENLFDSMTILLINPDPDWLSAAAARLSASHQVFCGQSWDARPSLPDVVDRAFLRSTPGDPDAGQMVLFLQRRHQLGEVVADEQGLWDQPALRGALDSASELVLCQNEAILFEAGSSSSEARVDLIDFACQKAGQLADLAGLGPFHSLEVVEPTGYALIRPGLFARFEEPLRPVMTASERQRLLAV
jgi:hypothetical protein